MQSPNGTMAGKVCLVTGTTSGIGKITALELARMGARVLMVCRDQERGQAVAREIIAASGNDSVELLLADLSSQSSIRELAAQIHRRHDRLDVLVNNAGVVLPRRSVSVDGIEATFATNHLGYFLLTTLLLDLLTASAPARIVNVSSALHSRGKIDFNDLQGERSYTGGGAYNQSKLANVLFTYELARRLDGTGVTANCLHPGVVRTGLGRNATGRFKLLLTVVKPFLSSPEKGAETSVYLASSPEAEGVTGQYFVNKRTQRSSPESYDETVAHRLWQVSEQMTQAGGPKGWSSGLTAPDSIGA